MDSNHPTEVITYAEEEAIARGAPADTARAAARARYARLTSDEQGRLHFRMESGVRVPVANHLAAIVDEVYQEATVEQRAATIEELAQQKATSGDYSL